MHGTIHRKAMEQQHGMIEIGAVLVVFDAFTLHSQNLSEFGVVKEYFYFFSYIIRPLFEYMPIEH